MSGEEELTPEEVAMGAIIKEVGLDDMEGGDAFAMAQRLRRRGWQLTRVGDEERLRAELAAARAELDNRRYRASFVALAPQPPSPASQGEER